MFAPLKTEMNTLPSRYKLSLQPYYASTLPGKAKIAQKQPTAYRSAFC